MNAGVLDERTVSKDIQHVLAHACHDPHAADHVGRVGELDADLGQGGSDGTHAEWKHIHRPSCSGGAMMW